MPDQNSIEPLIEEHQNIFNKEKINSVSTDKGYYSKKNETFLASQEVNEIGIQRPNNIHEKHPKPMTEEVREKLINRRSGIEALIGHAKQVGQLGRSRMKSDKGIEASGYTSILGFNMRQLIRHQKGKMKEKVA